MKVATRQDFQVAIEHQRVVGDRVAFDQQFARSVPQHIETRAHHLRLAAERVRVLNPLTIHVRGANLTALEQLLDDGRRVDLTLVSAQFLNARIEWCVASENGIDRHCAGQQPHGKITLRVEQPVDGDRGRDLSAVEQGETFLGRRNQRRNTGLFDSLRTGDRAISGEHPAFTKEHQRHMRKWREVARCTHRALPRYCRQHVGIQERGEGVKCFRF